MTRHYLGQLAIILGTTALIATGFLIYNSMQ